MSEFQKAAAMVVELEHLLYLEAAMDRGDLTKERCQQARTQLDLAAPEISTRTFDDLQHRVVLIEQWLNAYPHTPPSGS